MYQGQPVWASFFFFQNLQFRLQLADLLITCKVAGKAFWNCKISKIIYIIDSCGEMIVSPLWEVKVQFQLQCGTAGAGRSSAGCVFTTGAELNIWLNILDVGTHAVPACTFACLCARGRDGELYKAESISLKVTAVSDSQAACLLV